MRLSEAALSFSASCLFRCWFYMALEPRSVRGYTPWSVRWPARPGSTPPCRFSVAALLAGITGLAFAELAARLPRAAGEAVFVDHAFGISSLTRIVGLAVVAVGLIAGAAITTAFAGYMSELTSLPRPVVIAGLVVMLGAVSVSGIKKSVALAGVFTVIEVLGLGLILWFGSSSANFDQVGEILVPDAGWSSWLGIAGGAFVAFFAFLGFEDIDAMAEETKQARRVLPTAIIVTLVISTILYVIVVGTAVLVVDPAVLGDSGAPLVLVFEQSGGSGWIMATFGALAMVNGVLVQLIMVSRVLYGLGRQGSLPKAFGRVESRFGTPVTATLTAMTLMLLMALAFDLGFLARLTSLLTISVFTIVNLALVKIKKRDGSIGQFEVPGWMPYVGVIVSTGLLVGEVIRQVSL